MSVRPRLTSESQHRGFDWTGWKLVMETLGPHSLPVSSESALPRRSECRPPDRSDLSLSDESVPPPFDAMTPLSDTTDAMLLTNCAEDSSFENLPLETSAFEGILSVH